jgi:hypothetical protein
LASATLRGANRASGLESQADVSHQMLHLIGRTNWRIVVLTNDFLRSPRGTASQQTSKFASDQLFGALDR